MIDYKIYIVLGVVLFLIVFLYKEYIRPVLSFLIGICVFLLTGIISPKEALTGFSNVDLAVIVLLLLISNALSKTSIITTFFNAILSKKNTPSIFKLKMMGMIGVLSAFFNNTPLVAMFMPFVNNWAKEKQQPVSRFLIPLSFASILGGCITLIGTSTNLIVNGLAVESGETSLEIFDFLYVGLPMMVIGSLYLYFFGDRLLPKNEGVSQNSEIDERLYFLEAHIQANSPLIGRSVEDGGLRNLDGLFLVEITRKEKPIRPVSPTEVLEEDDILFFGGDLESIADLTQPSLGLSLPTSCEIPVEERSEIVEVIISANSQLIGKKVKESNFRGKYDGAIIAVHRDGEKLWGKIGDLVLKAGDVLLILAGKDFNIRTKNSPAFYRLSLVKEIKTVQVNKAIFLVGSLIAAIALVFCGVPLFLSLIVILTLMILMKVVTPLEIRNSIDYNLILIIAFGIALGKAMVNSGAAELIAEGMLQIKGIGIPALLGGIFIITNLLSAFMTSKAAVAITLPIALSLAHQLQLPVQPFILIVAFGGAANFITPIGYQTNLMVYGPGGYQFKDFFKIGFPLTILYLFVSVFVLGYLYNLI